MAMLTFFPWLTIEEPLKFKEFQLVQFKRKLLPIGHGKPVQSKIDRLLKPYLRSEAPVESATILQMDGYAVLDDLNDLERENVFAIAELIRFSGLSIREYFGMGFWYCNADNFTCVIQPFVNQRDGVTIETRRRDGRTLDYVSGNSLKVQVPRHVRTSFAATRLDVPLLKSLLSARAEPWWDQFFESIFWFNRANTDSDTITREIEAVEMIGAFERVQGLSGGNERQLRKAFITNLLPREEILSSRGERVAARRFEGCSSVREAWIADFFRLRGDHSHGRKKARYNSAWLLQEHLLLGAFAFPLLVKALLAQHGLYSLNKQDRLWIDSFEKLASAPIFKKPDAQSSSNDWPWNRILAEAALSLQ